MGRGGYTPCIAVNDFGIDILIFHCDTDYPPLEIKILLWECGNWTLVDPRKARVAITVTYILSCPQPPCSSSPRRRDKMRSPSPRLGRHDSRRQEHEHGRQRDRSRDRRSSTRRDVKREDEYDTRHRRQERDRSREGSGDEEDRREKGKKCVKMYFES